MDYVIAILDMIGASAFFLAFYFGHFTYRETRKTAGYWLMFSIAALLAFYWGITLTFETMNVYPPIMDEFQIPLFAGAAVIFSVIARLTYDGLVSSRV